AGASFTAARAASEGDRSTMATVQQGREASDAPDGSPLVRFPPGFLWGAGTSAHQVEGGNLHNDWWRFEQRQGAIADGARSGEACRHWELFDEDFALAAADGHTMHRLSVEWSRIEPE